MKMIQKTGLLYFVRAFEYILNPPNKEFGIPLFLGHTDVCGACMYDQLFLLYDFFPIR